MTTALDDTEGWTRFDCSASDGLALAGRKYGWDNTGAMPVICLTGLTRNSADFHELALHLAYRAKTPRRVLALDYRGRGMSAHDRNWENYNPLVEAGDVMAAATALDIGRAAFIGTSRGGMVTMVIAALRPGMIGAAVFNDVGPEIDGRGLVRIRNYVEKGRDFASWDEAVEAVRAIGESQFPRFGPQDWERQAQAIFREQDGKVVRRYDAALTRTLAAINLDNPLPSMWPQFAGLGKIPLLVIRGERSDLLSRETLEKMHQAHPGMRAITVADQGHAPDLGTENLPAAIEGFLDAAEGKRG